MNWIENSAQKGKALKRQFKLRDIDIFIKDALPKGMDPDFVFKYIASVVPEHLLNGIDIVYVGQFDHLIKRQVRAVYEDGAIFVTNDQESDMDLIDDIIHEVAHATETTHKDVIYGDGKLEEEFKKKRAELYRFLSKNGRKPPMSLLHDMNFNQEVDDYLFIEIGYPILSQIAVLNKLFLGAYSATSVREYFASGFELFYMGDKEPIKDICPVLYMKLTAVTNLGGQ